LQQVIAQIRCGGNSVNIAKLIRELTLCFFKLPLVELLCVFVTLSTNPRLALSPGKTERSETAKSASPCSGTTAFWSAKSVGDKAECDSADTAGFNPHAYEPRAEDIQAHRRAGL